LPATARFVVQPGRKRIVPALKLRCQLAADFSLPEVLVSAPHFLTRVAHVLAGIPPIIPVIATIVASIDPTAAR
jgi:hypothetical protein